MDFYLELHVFGAAVLVRKKDEINTGFYGDKILYKDLKFFDKIFVPKFCRRRFRHAP